jgi:hypothetical protein
MNLQWVACRIFPTDCRGDDAETNHVPTKELVWEKSIKRFIRHASQFSDGHQRLGSDRRKHDNGGGRASLDNAGAMGLHADL